MAVTNRRLISLNWGLDTDETIFNVRVEWLLEMPNPDNPEMPFQRKVSQIIALSDMTDGEVTAMNARIQAIGVMLERKYPLVPPPE